MNRFEVSLLYNRDSRVSVYIGTNEILKSFVEKACEYFY